MFLFIYRIVIVLRVYVNKGNNKQHQLGMNTFKYKIPLSLSLCCNISKAVIISTSEIEKGTYFYHNDNNFDKKNFRKLYYVLKSPMLY